MTVNVLVVDDSDVIRSMILKTLRLADIPVAVAFEASNGHEALGVLEDNCVDVVLTDINMPVMDGLEMLRRIRASDRFSDMPVIVVTTEGATSRVTELAQAGVSAYVRKPFTPEQIREAVLEVTDGLDVSAEDPAPTLREVFPQVLNRFVLMDAEPTDASQVSADPVGGPLLEARMSFNGYESGVLSVIAPRAVCVEMAASAMGVDVTDPKVTASAGDVLGEVLNMTCGYFCVAREMDQAADLTPPVVMKVEAEEWLRAADSAQTIAFLIEGHPVLLSFAVRRRR